MSIRRTLLRGAILAGILATGFMLVVVFGVAFAILGGSFTSCETRSLPASATVNAGPPPSSYALQNIPPQRLRLYEQAGQRFDIDWTFLASIGAQECGNRDCPGDNGSGCAGPMQIAERRGSPCSPGDEPTLWERYAVNAHPGEPLSIDDPADAIDTAARILRQAMGAPPTGGTYREYQQAACTYYGACSDATVAYAEEVMARAVQYGFQGAGSPTATSPELGQPISEPGQGCQTSGLTGGEANSSSIVKLAESQVGQGEHPPGSNCTKYGPCEEWCSLFVAWIWMHAGVAIPGPTSLYGYSGSLYTWDAEHGGRVLPASAAPAPGDAVFYGAGPAESDHVGIVARVLPDGRIETIEGNYAGRVSRVGPFPPSNPVGEAAPIYGYAQPPTPQQNGGRS